MCLLNFCMQNQNCEKSFNLTILVPSVHNPKVENLLPFGKPPSSNTFRLINIPSLKMHFSHNRS